MRALILAAVLAASSWGFAKAGEPPKDIDGAGYFSIATFRVKPERLASFEKIMKQVVVDTRAEPGNVDYRLHKVSSEPLTYITYEVFRNEDAADQHNSSDHIRKIVPDLLETLNGDIKITVMTNLH